MRTRGMGVKEAGALLYAKCPGSLADGIGVFADREAKEELDRGLPKLVADAIAKGLTPEEIKGAYQACVAKMSQHKDFSAV